MTQEFIKKRIKEQEEYILTLHSKEHSLKRFIELMTLALALAVHSRLNKLIQ